MLGLWIEDGTARLRSDLQPPAECPDETRIGVRLAGVCATDLALLQGYAGFRGVPGHEFVGLALDGPLAGRRVVGEINAGCGGCEACLGGDPRHCAERTVLGILGRPGAFAEELRLPEANLCEVPSGLSDRAAVFCEPAAAALAILEAAPDLCGARALVVGDGRLGLLCAHAIARAGALTEVAGRHAERARLLPDGVPLHLGRCETSGPPGRGEYDLVVEASGAPSVLARALTHLRPRGTLVLKTTAAQPATLDLAPLVVDELRLVGSRCGRFGPALEWLSEGTLPLESMIDAVYPLNQGPEALRHAGRSGSLKVLIENRP